MMNNYRGTVLWAACPVRGGPARGARGVGLRAVDGDFTSGVVGAVGPVACWQGLDDLGLRVRAERGGDPGVQLGDPRTDRQELGGEVGHDAGRHVLPGHDGLLCLARNHRGRCDLVSAADLPLDQPRPQPRVADPRRIACGVW